MENIWRKINDEIPMYMNDICKKYNLLCVKITPIKTALIAKSYAIFVEIDRFGIDLVYVYREEGNIVAYACGNYLAKRYDENDRVNIIEGRGADVFVRNDIVITSNGLVSKCEDVLSGDLRWISDYKKSSRYSRIEMKKNEVESIEKYWIALNK